MDLIDKTELIEIRRILLKRRIKELKYEIKSVEDLLERLEHGETTMEVLL